MRLVDAAAEHRAYPYVVTLAPDRNVRWPVSIDNDPASADRRQAHAFYALGAVDAVGRVTDAGRTAVLEGMRRKARGSAATYCIVWAKDECTFLLRDGGTIEGRRPPRAEPACPEDYEAVNAHLVSIDWIELSEDYACSHLCVRNLCADRVEIASGAPMALGHFDELPLEGPGSELRRIILRCSCPRSAAPSMEQV